MKKCRTQGLRSMPKVQSMAKAGVEVKPLTVGDLITAAFDALGDTSHVVQVLGSARLSERVGRKLVFI